MNLKEHASLSSTWKLALEEEAKSEESWLAKENFPSIQQLAIKNRIVPLCLNICDEEAFDQFSALLKGCAVKVNTLYLANIYDYFSSLGRKEKESQSFRRNVKKIALPDTVIIEAICNPIKGLIEGLKQNIVKTIDPISGNKYCPDHLRGLKSKQHTDKDFTEEHRKEHYPGALLLQPRSD